MKTPRPYQEAAVAAVLLRPRGAERCQGVSDLGSAPRTTRSAKVEW